MLAKNKESYNVKLFKNFLKKEHCILLQESETSRIVQRRHPVFDESYIIARERLIKERWKIVSHLYSNQCASLDKYIQYFNIDEREPKINHRVKQFEC